MVGEEMRWYRLIAPLVLVFAFACGAKAQTFTIDQPGANANNKGKVKVVRPGEVSVTPEKPSAAAKKRASQPEFSEVKPAGTAKKTANLTAKKTSKSAKKLASKPVSPPVSQPPAEVAANTPPPEPPKAKPPQPELQPLPTMSRLSTAELQQRIESGLRNDRMLGNASNLKVHVTDTEIVLDGVAANSQERLEAIRLAQSYGGNRKFKDQVQIAGSKSPTASAPVNANLGTPTTVGNSFTQKPR
ncbi:MAG TPA: BON domain-containing protein [Terriglobales bacterium]